MGQLVRPQPDAHGVVLGPEDGGVAHTGQTLEFVEHVDQHVVADENRVVALGRRIESDDLQNVRGFLGDGDALAGHFLGQGAFGRLDPVVDVDGVLVGVGTHGKGYGHGERAVTGTRGTHVDHVVHAVDLLLKRSGDRGGDDFGAGTGIVGRHVDLGRHDLRILGNGQRPDGRQPRQDDHERNDDGKDRAAQEEA